MAGGKPELTVIVSAQAAADLEEIYRYNANRNGSSSANRWEEFLKAKIAGLASGYMDGLPIPGRSDLRYILMKKSGRWKDGHLAIYRVDDLDAAVYVLHVFHTKQDWQEKI